MRKQSFLVCAPLFLAWMACSSSSGSGSSAASDGGPSIPLAKSSSTRTPATSIPSASVAAAVGANNAFALDLYGRLAATSGASNVLTSPISASLALTMTYAGARGETATQMATALHLGGAAATIFDGQNALSQALASRGATALAADEQDAETPPSPDNYQLQVVNSVWGEQTYTWQPAFLDVLATSYGTGVYEEDFISQSNQARQTINTWVSDATNDKINDLLPAGSITQDTRLVLVNAIHLKFPWASTFSVNATAPATFTTGAGTSVSVPFMNQTSPYAYVDDGAAQTVVLPLVGQQEAIVISMPHGDLATYEVSLSVTSPIAAPPSPSSIQYVALSLPKMTFTSATFSLKTELQAMGMTDAFEVADFSGMTTTGSLVVEDVKQKATIGLQETGVEAAAATAVILADASGTFEPPTPVPMVIDRPFLISIVDLPTGAVLFLGHVEDPSNAGGP